MLARIHSTDGTSADLLAILTDAASYIGAELFDVVCKPNNALRFKLKLADSKSGRYQRISYDAFGRSRRTGRLCWHGFRDFFSRAFELNPYLYFDTGIGVYSYNAPVKRVIYDGVDNFKATYPETNHEIVRGGVLMFLSDCCECLE